MTALEGFSAATLEAIRGMTIIGDPPRVMFSESPVLDTATWELVRLTIEKCRISDKALEEAVGGSLARDMVRALDQVRAGKPVEHTTPFQALAWYCRQRRARQDDSLMQEVKDGLDDMSLDVFLAHGEGLVQELVRQLKAGPPSPAVTLTPRAPVEACEGTPFC
jgi:hypothetical protein